MTKLCWRIAIGAGLGLFLALSVWSYNVGTQATQDMREWDAEWVGPKGDVYWAFVRGDPSKSDLVRKFTPGMYCK